MTTVAPPHGTYALAGVYAEAWFRRLDGAFGSLTTRETHQLEDEILDCALADAGVTPSETPLSSVFVFPESISV